MDDLKYTMPHHSFQYPDLHEYGRMTMIAKVFSNVYNTVLALLLTLERRNMIFLEDPSIQPTISNRQGISLWFPSKCYQESGAGTEYTLQ